MRPERLRQLLIGLFVIAVAATPALARCSGCGCKGGPGYHAPSGNCVGHASLYKVCGNPPTTHCTFEGGAHVDIGAVPSTRQPGQAVGEECTFATASGVPRANCHPVAPRVPKKIEAQNPAMR